MEHDWRPEFEQAIGETFGDYVSPPVPCEDSSAHESCEVIWKVLGRSATPTDLATIDEAQIRRQQERQARQAATLALATADRQPLAGRRTMTEEGGKNIWCQESFLENR